MNKMDHDKLWESALGELEMSLSKANFTTWFKNTHLVSYNNDVVIINVPNLFTKAWFEKKYNHTVLKVLQTITQSRIKEVVYTIDLDNKYQPNDFFKHKTENDEQGCDYDKTQIKTQTQTQFQTPDNNLNNLSSNTLNHKYKFENFIVGKGSELAHAAAMAVVKYPFSAYNPLFIYGDVGLGKTHLMQAIGHGFIQQNPSTKVVYVTLEKFMNDFIQAVRMGKTDNFNNLYRNCDLLLIDDIEFISGKEGTQDAFFHTFNSLYQNNKQIVLTSDRPPKSIAALEDRLVSRFECGMVADISSPDFETRLAILDVKCKDKGINLKQDVMHYVASNFQNNIRELEGALNRIITYEQINNAQVDLNIVVDIFSYITKPKSKNNPITTKLVINTVINYYNIEFEQLISNSRKKELVMPRQIIMYLLRKETNISYPLIGKEVGDRDHTTVIHAFNKINNEINKNERLKTDIKNIKERLYSY